MQASETARMDGKNEVLQIQWDYLSHQSPTTNIYLANMYFS